MFFQLSTFACAHAKSARANVDSLCARLCVCVCVYVCACACVFECVRVQSNAKQDKAKQSNAKQSKSKPTQSKAKAKQRKAKQRKARQSKAKQSKATAIAKQQDVTCNVALLCSALLPKQAKQKQSNKVSHVTLLCFAPLC